jgi:ParB family chromosome partitioning protein
MESVIRLINVDDIIPNRFQPRLEFDETGLNELAESIREHGIVQPLVLRRIGDKYEIIAGERRYKASVKIGITAVPAIITDLDDNESAEVAIVENTQRKAMSAIEEARSYKKLLDRNYITQDQLAKRLGTSQANIANKVRLLNLDNAVQDALLKEKISERHARSLLRVTDKQKQVELLNRIIQEKMPVRQLDEEIDKILGGYNKNQSTVGNIATNRSDVNLNDIMNNAVDITTNEPIYKYINPKESMQKKKDSLFFNNLENESVNMNPTSSLGFNPFEHKLDNDDNDFDILNLEEDKDEEIDEPTEQTQVVEKVKEVVIETPEDVLKNIKDIIKQSITQQIGVESEEFNFDDQYQLIIRVSKNKEQ